MLGGMISPALAERIARVSERAKAFYAATSPGHYLVSTTIPCPWLPDPDFTTIDWQDPAGLQGVLDIQLERWRVRWAAKAHLDDDTLPSIAPFFGYAEHTAWTGQRVVWQQDTSLAEPLIHRPEDIDTLAMQPDCDSFRRLRDSYAYLRSRQDGSFLLAMRGATSPLELANSLLGDRLFTDLKEEPEMIHRLLRRIVDIYPGYLETLRGWADQVAGGHCFFIHQSWVGPDAMGHMSNDAAMLVSPATYRTFGLPYDEALTKRWRHIVFHVHTQGMHYLPELCKLSRLSLLQMQADPSVGPNLGMIDAILAATGTANLLLTATSDEIRANIDRLTERNVFFNASCTDSADAEDLIVLLRRRSQAS